jgi:hypothetical protein
MDPLVFDSHNYNPPNSFIIDRKHNLTLHNKSRDKFSYISPVALNFLYEVNSFLFVVFVPYFELQTVPTLFVHADCTQRFDFGVDALLSRNKPAD